MTAIPPGVSSLPAVTEKKQINEWMAQLYISPWGWALSGISSGCLIAGKFRILEENGDGT